MALPLSDHLLVVAPNGMVVALDAGGRHLWEALEAGCSEDDLVDASVRHGNVSSDVARSNVSRALASWRALGLINPTAGKVDPALVAPPVVVRPLGRTPELDAVYLVGDRPVRVRCDDDVVAGVIEAACRAITDQIDRIKFRRAPKRPHHDGRLATSAGSTLPAVGLISPSARHDAKARETLERATALETLPWRTLASTRSSSVQPAASASQRWRPPASSATTMPFGATTSR